MLAGPWPHRGAPISHRVWAHCVRGPGDRERARQQGARPGCTRTLWRPSPTPTLAVAMVTRSTLAWALRSTWWLPEALVKISTPSRPMSTCGLWAEVGQEKGPPHPPTCPPRASPQPEVMTPSPGCLQIPDLLRGSEGRADLWGVQSSSQISLPRQVSRVASTASPKGTVSCSWETRAHETPCHPRLGYLLT